jgi:hypothetical protein
LLGAFLSSCPFKGEGSDRKLVGAQEQWRARKEVAPVGFAWEKREKIRI